jgi:peptide/nickel transport system permease protein
MTSAPLTERQRRFAVAVRGDLLTRVSAVVLAILVVLALISPFLPLGNPEETGAGPRLAAPSSQWPAGTDSLGRTVLPRVFEGLRTTLLVAGAAVLLTVAVATLLGMIAAYRKGPVGELIARGADVLFSFPAILLGLLVASISGPGLTGAVISISLICSPLMVRVVRAAALGVVSRDFVVAAKVGGAGDTRILFVHVLPNIAGVVAIQATYALSLAMLIESSLSFLGLGVQPPQASLGSLVGEGAVYLSIAPWLVLVPGVVLAVTITSVNLVGDGLRDVLDVRGREARK